MISGLVRNELKQKSLERSRKSSKPMFTVPCTTSQQERRCHAERFQLKNEKESYVSFEEGIAENGVVWRACFEAYQQGSGRRIESF